MQKADLLHLVSAGAWKKSWNVNSRSVGNGVRSIRYLASYVFRTAISNNRVIAIENDRVVFRHTDTKSGTNKTMSLSPFEFIRGFLQHVLPTGLMKIRYYGFMHPSTKIPLKLAVTLLEALFTVPPAKKIATQISGVPSCELCNGIVRFVRFIRPKDIIPVGGFTQRHQALEDVDNMKCCSCPPAVIGLLFTLFPHNKRAIGVHPSSFQAIIYSCFSAASRRNPPISTANYFTHHPQHIRIF